MPRVFPPPHLAAEARLLESRHPDLPGLVFATSGTTGDPKWIVHSQEGLDWCARTVNDHFGCTSQDIWGLALPEFHVGGYCLTHRAKLAGGQLVRLPHRWQPERFHAWLGQEKVTLTSLVPTQVFDLLDANLSCPSSLRLALIGGEHLNPHLFDKALALGWPLVTSYGMTETAGLVAASGIGERQLRPLPGWQLTTAESGLLAIDGPGLFRGHLTDQGLQPADHPFITSDLVTIESGTLTIKGRSDDQIKVRGELVDLATLRQSLAALLPDYRTTLLALPDDRCGHLLIPVVESKPQASVLEKIATWNRNLPAFSRCQEPVLRPNWPLTPLGKLDYRTLHQQVTNERNCLLHKESSEA